MKARTRDSHPRGAQMFCGPAYFSRTTNTMLVLLSPAKTLDYESPLPDGLPATKPVFTARAAELIAILRSLSPQQIAQLMSLSDKLATLNAARYAAWQPQASAANARQALYAFNGDVYEGLDAASLTLDEAQWAQGHLVILSGLYGALRPLDLLQPYRLEMGTRLANAHGSSLYDFWGDAIARYLDEMLADSLENTDDGPFIINLASQEYFKAVQRSVLKARVVECVFEDYKSGVWKIISFYAKRARGLMARYIISGRLKHPQQLCDFKSEGYVWAPEVSQPERLVFRRRV